MNLKEAWELALKDPKVSRLLDSGFYLSSAVITDPDGWVLVFYNPETGNVFSASVDGKSIKLTSVQRPLKEGFYERMETTDLESEDLVNIVRENVKGQVIKIIISVKPNSIQALVVTSNLKTVYLEIDPETRRVVKRERGNLIRPTLSTFP